MTENNIQNKQKYFQEYKCFIEESKIKDYVLQLYCITTISEKECNDNFNKSRTYILSNFTDESIIKKIRNLGYATPYKELCIKKLIEYGWIKKIK